MKKYYLAYGSNLNVEQMKHRCSDAKPIGTAWIHGYQLLFKGSKTGSYLTIEKAEKSKVPGAVVEVSAADARRLDLYEGYPNFYYKKEMELPVKLH
ncbi:MAG: gamma-glutamylcyclotransferase, partial [Ruminococcus sp.]|nr:gamma-glutamylcyclotransferase [Ruminococcus sp.]